MRKYETEFKLEVVHTSVASMFSDIYPPTMRRPAQFHHGCQVEPALAGGTYVMSATQPGRAANHQSAGRADSAPPASGAPNRWYHERPHVHRAQPRRRRLFRTRSALTTSPCWRAAHARAVELLGLVQLPAPEAIAARYPHQLSGGQRQRVMIAAAIACRPRLLIADEPTTALDATVQAQILDLLHRLQQEMSMAMLLITHDLGVVARWADTISVMCDGELIESGETAAVFAAPQHAYTRGLVQAPLLDACAPGTRLPEIQVERGSDGRATGFQVVRKADATPAAPAPALDAAPLLRVEGLAVRYPGRDAAAAAVDGVSFTLAQGEVLGLVGESGCGKSSLSRALLRLVPASGSVELAGRDVLALRGAELRAHRRDVQMVFQDPSAVPAVYGLALHSPELFESTQDSQS